MKQRLSVWTTTLLVVAFVFALASLVSRHLTWRQDLGDIDPSKLQRSTVQWLRTLEVPIDVTAFVSADPSVPPAHRGFEQGVNALLAAMHQAAGGNFRYRVLDPGLDPEHGPGYASRRGASPVHVDRVLSDAESQATVWASLVVAAGARREVLLQDLRPEDLPHLEALLVTHLTANLRPVIAVAAPADRLPGLMSIVAANGAEPVAVDFDRDRSLPESADALLWMKPQQAGAEHAAAVRRLLNRGVTVIIGGEPFEVSVEAGARDQWTVRRSNADLGALLRPFGLRVAETVVVDRRPEQATAPTGLLTRIPPSQTDTKSLRIPPTGMLMLDRVSPLEIDRLRARAAGYTVEVVSTTSEHSTLVVPGDGGKIDAEQLGSAIAVPKQPWLVHLVPEDPWRGALVVGANRAFGEEVKGVLIGHSNVMFLRGILRTMADEDRIARRRVARPAPDLVPELSLAERIGSRALVVLLVPAVWLLAWRRLGGRSGQRSVQKARRWPVVAGLLAIVVVSLAIGLVGTGRGPALDLSAAKTNRPAAATRELLDASAGLTVEYWASDSARMPAGIKATSARVITALRALGLRPRVSRADTLDAEGRRQLHQAGITPFDVDRIEDDSIVTVSLYSGLLLRWNDRTEVIPRLDERSADQLEFLLASALRRLQTGHRPRVGVLSDMPRLSPAEAHVDYHQKGFAAPIGSDVYSGAKQLLADSGYEVVYIHPEAVVVPEDLDLLVWLQPRFVQRSLPQVTGYPARGGDLLIAVQHYNVQQRQYRGAGFETVYWPQPQFHGLNDWLDSFGVRQIGEKRGELAGEILYDRNHARLELATQVNRSVMREHDAQSVARPFLIRAHGSGLSKESGITAGLGELLFIWGSRFTLDPAVLSNLGVTARTLVQTSRHWWTFEWSGRWLPQASFIEPEGLDKEPQPLALWLEGRFPVARTVTAQDGRPTLHFEVPADVSKGRILLVGCSEMFKDSHLFDARYQHDQFLRNAVAAFAHPPDLAAIQARQRAPERLPVQSEATRLTLRGITILLSPLLFAIAGLILMRLRRPLRRRF